MITPKQERFCREYVIDHNGTQAAIRAGYAKKAAKEQASDLLTKPNIRKFIKTLQVKISERLNVTADDVVKELAKCGFSNIQDFIESGNSTADLSHIKREKAAAIAGIKVTTSTYGQGKDKTTEKMVEFKLYDKISALEKLGKHLGIFEKDNGQKETKITVKLK